MIRLQWCAQIYLAKLLFQTKAAYVLVYQKRGTDRRVTRKSESSATVTSDTIEPDTNGFKTDEDMETN